MIQQAPRADPFKEQLRGSLQHDTLESRTVKIARHATVPGETRDNSFRNRLILDSNFPRVHYR